MTPRQSRFFMDDEAMGMASERTAGLPAMNAALPAFAASAPRIGSGAPW